MSRNEPRRETRVYVVREHRPRRAARGTADDEDIRDPAQGLQPRGSGARLPLFWADDKNANKALDPESSSVYWASEPGAVLAGTYGKRLQPKMSDAYDKMLVRHPRPRKNPGDSSQGDLAP